MEIQDKVILTDCDGVLLDWEYGFSRYMSRKGFKPVRNDTYSIGLLYDISKEWGKQHVRTFNESAAIGSLPPFRDAKKYVRKIHEEFGYVFHCLTSLSDDPHAYKLRLENLENVFGKGVFEELVCIGCGDDKDKILEPYRDSGCMWVEDKPENAVTGANMGLDSVLITHLHNETFDDPSVRKVTDWRDIYESIL